MGMKGSDDFEGAGKNPDLAIAATKEDVLGSRRNRAEVGTLALLAESTHLMAIPQADIK